MADGSIIIDTRIDQTGAVRDLESLKSKLEKAGGGLKTLGSSLTKFVTLPIAGAGIAGVKFAMDQEQSFAKVSTLLDSSETDFGKYKSAIRTASSEMGVSFDEYTESVYGSISAGVKAGDAIDFVATAAKLAKGGFTQTATAVDIMTTAINAYGLEQKDAQRVSDILINTQNLGKTTVDELASSMGAVIPTAQAQNVSLEQLSTGYAVLTKNGIATSEAGTYLKGMFGELGKAGTEVDKVLREKTGKSFSELQAEGMSTADALGILQTHAEDSGIKMSDMFGSIEAGSAAMVLAKGEGAEFNEILASMGDVTGLTEEAFNKMENTATAKLMKSFNALRNALAGLADIFLPTITKMIEWFTKLINKFASLEPAGQKLIIIIAAIAAAIGPVITFMGILVAGFVSFAGTMATAAAAGTTVTAAIAGLAAPFAIAIGIIAAIIAIGVLLYKNWDTIKEKAQTVFTAFGPLLDVMKQAFASLVGSLQPIWETLKQLFASLMPIIKTVATIIGIVLVPVFGVVISAVMAVISAIGPLVNAFLNVIDVVLNVVNAIIAVFTGDWQGAMDYWKQATQSTIDFVKNLFTAVVNFFSTFVNSIIAFFHNLYIVLVGNSIVPDMVNAILLWFQNMGTWVLETVSSFITSVITFFSGLWSNIQAIFSAGMAIVQAVAVAGFNLMKTVIGLAMTGIKIIITTIWNAIKRVFTTAMNVIKTLVSGAFNAIKAVISTVMNVIKSVISSIWNAIRSVVKSVINSIRSAVSSGFNSIKSVISSVMNGIRSLMSSVWNAISSLISSAISRVRSVVQSGFNAVRSTISSVMNSVRSTISSAFNAVVSSITSAMSRIKSTIKSGFTAALNIVKNMGSQFKAAGSKIVSMLADGIKGAVGKVTGAISNVVGKVRDFLPFSPAKVGPLDDIDHLNFHGPMVDSIKRGTRYVQGAMNKMLQMPEINHSLAVTGSGINSAQQPVSTNSYDQRNVSITVDASNIEELKQVIDLFGGLRQSVRMG